MNYKIVGGQKLSGTISTNISKNSAVALLCASLLNKGTTTLKGMPNIEEVKRLVEVLESIGVQVEYVGEDMKIIPPVNIDLQNLNQDAAGKTRSIALFLAPLAHLLGAFTLPLPGGCQLGVRTMVPHIDALHRLGIEVKETEKGFEVDASKRKAGEVIMYEASDTGVENALMAAAKLPGTTVIKFASANYMVQDLCFFLERCGVRIEGIGTSTLTVHGIEDISADITGFPGEDPIESMTFISLAATTGSEITVERCPIDFLELELLTFELMGLKYERSAPYTSENGRMRLVDITVYPSALHAPAEKIAPRPYPGINIDNLPFFVPVATQAEGRTLIHDWVYETRASYYLELNKLGANISMSDPHRVYVQGPTKLKGVEMKSPSALRPSMAILIGMLAAEGSSLLTDVYPIQRGYEQVPQRLQAIGAHIEEA